MEIGQIIRFDELPDSKKSYGKQFFKLGHNSFVSGDFEILSVFERKEYFNRIIYGIQIRMVNPNERMYAKNWRPGNIYYVNKQFNYVCSLDSEVTLDDTFILDDASNICCDINKSDRAKDYKIGKKPITFLNNGGKHWFNITEEKFKEFDSIIREGKIDKILEDGVK